MFSGRGHPQTTPQLYRCSGGQVFEYSQLTVAMLNCTLKESCRWSRSLWEFTISEKLEGAFDGH